MERGDDEEEKQELSLAKTTHIAAFAFVAVSNDAGVQLPGQAGVKEALDLSQSCSSGKKEGAAMQKSLFGWLVSSSSSAHTQQSIPQWPLASFLFLPCFLSPMLSFTFGSCLSYFFLGAFFLLRSWERERVSEEREKEDKCMFRLID